MPESNTSGSIDPQGQTDPQQPVDSAATNQNLPAGGSETFTRDQLDAHTDRIVKERIDKQNDKHAKEMAAKDAELKEALERAGELEKQVEGYKASAAHDELVANVAKKTGLPVSQIELLKGDTEEDLVQAAEAFKASMPSLYPAASEAAGAPSTMTKEDILSIKNPEERIRLMGLHPELFR